MDKELQNFYSLLKNIREYRGISLAQLSLGLCTPSNLHYFENGDRIPNYFMRNRLMARLGISPEEFEDYVEDEEYNVIETLVKLEAFILDNNSNEIEKLLNLLNTEFADSGKIRNQLVDVLDAFYLENNNGSKEEIRALFKNALDYTMKGIDIQMLDKYCLAPEEIFILERYLYYSSLIDSSTENLLSHKELYEKVFSYIQKSNFDKIAYIKLMSGVVVRYYELFKSLLNSKDRFITAEVIDEVIELERSKSRVYNLQKLIQIKRELNIISGWEEEMLEALSFAKQISGSDDIIKWKSDVLLFETSVIYSVSHTILHRRKMLSLSREQLADGICSVRTIMRLEKNASRAQQQIVSQLFQRLGLTYLFRRFEIATSEIEINNMFLEYKKLLNTQQIEAAEALKNKLLTNVDKTDKSNQQVLARLINVCNYEQGRISREEFANNILNTLSLTIPIDNIENADDYFFTKAEGILLYYLAAKVKNQKCEEIIEGMCNNIMSTNNKSVSIGFYDIIMEWVASNHGNKGNYTISDELARYNIISMLRRDRISMLGGCIYDIVWNNSMQETKKDNALIEKGIKACVALAEFKKSESEKKFYVTNLEPLL